jgi:hypothetical protein
MEAVLHYWYRIVKQGELTLDLGSTIYYFKNYGTVILTYFSSLYVYVCLVQCTAKVGNQYNQYDSKLKIW